LSAIRFHYCTLSCDRQRSCCRPLLPPIIVNCHHRRHCRCRQATTASTATTVFKPAIVHLPKKEATAAAPPAYQWQHHRENVYKSRQLGLI
jgi:hypothetical protein